MYVFVRFVRNKIFILPLNSCLLWIPLLLLLYGIACGNNNNNNANALKIGLGDNTILIFIQWYDPGTILYKFVVMKLILMCESIVNKRVINAFIFKLDQS